ncbi:MAG: hypothetical protein IJ207_10345 [Treponema sp.]|uniref:hypothetical protein n=1 Tax=Treponema sp. TaxID=166 RepID=UPI0025F3DC6F|nr:hypothetical protein [Treponema sp.]MBQ9282574.1 hypothetical protein [Treponema sp.]
MILNADTQILSSHLFLSQAALASCVFFLGLSFGSFVTFFLPQKNKKRRFAAFSLMCLFLTGAALVFTFLIFLEHNLFPFFEIQKNLHLKEIPERFFYSVLAFLFFLGVLTVLFWKILLPATVLIYAAMTLFTNHLLAEVFPSQKERIFIRMTGDEVLVGPEHIPQSLSASDSSMQVSVYELPELLLLPVKRNWFSFGVGLSLPERGIHQNPAVAAYLRFLLFREPRILKIDFPNDTVYPSLYSLCLKFQGEAVDYELLREL